MRDLVAQLEVRAPARMYAIRAREEATAPDVIAGTFYLFYVTIYALIDLGSTHSYVCIALTSEKKLYVEPTDYDFQVTNPLGQSVIVNLVCRNCPLKVKGCEFSADLMLLSFREFDVILGMDSLTKHDAVVNCTEERIYLKCQTGEELSGLPPDNEVEFVMDVISEIAPISITPYRMALAELKELKTQL
ncbi:uncharacterized protein LOC128285516 [Gossypium arboreum]|uniref:uncharacterized protein LOC128285516 n=1 Tax=Gossypium arboreum TaxID=29729 RepID=UPI0022F19509|nr:uncharacterized protein LOC128285516 [Gossypium arboreum]